MQHKVPLPSDAKPATASHSPTQQVELAQASFCEHFQTQSHVV